MRLPIFSVINNMGTPGFEPQSTSLLKLGEAAQSRLIALDDYLLVYLHVPSLAAMLESRGTYFRLRNRGKGDSALTDPLTRQVLGNNKVAHVTSHTDGHHVEVGIGSGLLGRVLFNFLPPDVLAS